MFQQTALPDKTTIFLHKIVEATKVVLQFTQQFKVLGIRKLLLNHVGGTTEHYQCTLTIGSIDVVLSVVIK